MKICYRENSNYNRKNATPDSDAKFPALKNKTMPKDSRELNV